MSRKSFRQPFGKLDHKGMASIVVVTVLVILLSLISIGFARLMSRAVNGSLNNQLSSSAGYAAQSALNDAIAYVQAHENDPTPPSSSTCNGLFTTNGGKIDPNFVAPDGDTSHTYKYTCILVNPAPPSLQYTLPPSQSQVATLNTVNSAGATVAPANLLFSWQASGADISKTNTSACSSPTLYDESTWSSKNCPPLLRVTLYPIDGGGNVIGASPTAQTGSRTFFLYPTNSGGNTINYSAQSDGSVVPVNCTSQPTTPNESTGNNLCSVVISGFGTAAPGLSYFYTRVTALYAQADLLIKSDDSSNNVLSFKGDQSLIDATAQVGSASKRLQARVAVGNAGDVTPSEGALPEDGLRSAEAICKQLDVNGGVVSNQGTFCNTQQPIIPPNPPKAFLCGAASGSCDPDSTASPQTISVPDSTAVNLYWDISSDPLDGPAACVPTGSTLGWDNPTGAGTGNTTTDPLSGGTAGETYTYEISCTNESGIPAVAIVNVVVAAIPPNGSNPPILPGPGNGTPGSPGCDDITVNVGFDGVNYEGTVSGSDGNICGIGISQCNGFNAGGGSLFEADFGNSGDAVGTAIGSAYVGCMAINGVWGYSGSPGSGGGSPGTPSQGWVSKGISYFGVKGGDISPGISSWCNDPTTAHGYLVCGVWVATGVSYCSASWAGVNESQYNGVIDTTNRFGGGVPNTVSPPGFVFGFPDASYVITNNPSAELEVDCNGPPSMSPFIWHAPVPPNH